MFLNPANTIISFRLYFTFLFHFYKIKILRNIYVKDREKILLKNFSEKECPEIATYINPKVGGATAEKKSLLISSFKEIS